ARKLEAAVVVDDPATLASAPLDGALEAVAQELDVALDSLFRDTLKLVPEHLHRHDALLPNEPHNFRDALQAYLRDPRLLCARAARDITSRCCLRLSCCRCRSHRAPPRACCMCWRRCG